jgi:hypothetical protein
MSDQQLTDREVIRGSILQSRLDLREMQRDLHDTVLKSVAAICQSRELIAKADDAIARR